MKKDFIYLLLFLFCFHLVGSRLLAAPERPAGKPLTIGIVQEWSHFNPINSNLASTDALMAFLVRGMVTRDATGTLHADLAEEIPSLANKKARRMTDKGKRKVIARWKIKDSAKWGDGHEVTCADWWMGWQIGLSPHVSTSEKSLFQKIEKIEWTESRNKVCQVTYTNDDWAFDRDLPPLVPRHLEEAVFEKWKNQNEAYDQNSIYVKNPTEKGLYNGPYTVDEFQLGSHLILKANPLFYGEKPHIEKFIIKLVSDASTLRAQLETGAIDLISAVGFPLDTALQLDQESRPDSTYKVRLQPSAIFQGFFINSEDPILKDEKVRQALKFAINKIELCRAFFNEKIAPAETMLTPGSPEYQTEKPVFNPKKARELLDTAGWKLDPGSSIRKKNGKSLEIRFSTSAGLKILETLQVAICNQFEKVGARCVIKNSPPRVLLGQSVPHGDYGIAMFGWGILPDTSVTSNFSSQEIPSEKNGWTGQNTSRWKSAAVDQWLHRFDHEWDPKKRIQPLRKIDQEMIETALVIPIYHRKEGFVLPKQLEGFTDDISPTNFSSPEKWHL